MKKALLAFFCIFAFLHFASPVLSISSFSKYPSNPLLNSSEGPNILYKDGLYKMWYTANYGLGWRVNYGYSLNGIDGWIFPKQQVISPGSSDGFEIDTANPNVIFNKDLNIYQMWYSSISSNWAGGDDRFRIGYATSLDGINWNKVGWALKGTSGMWDSGGPARGESIIYKNGIYHLWYAATDSGFNWRIGYATSIDGINFEKQNNGNPVLVPNELWELNNIEYPNVIFNNGIYEMFYASGQYDNTTQIIYATSIDGINWDKPSDKNPLLSGGSFYDNLTLTSPSVLRFENGSSMMWYGGNVYYIMLATEGTLPTSTPIPSNTPTPSPTLAPTPSPTPTPVQTKKIIIVPGMGGSWNREALLTCSKNPTDVNWIQTYNYYSDLRNRLELDGLTPLIFAYDWRKPVPENGLKLKQFIDSQTNVGEKVYIVGHSMGGLVARSYLEHEQSSNKIEKLLTAGSPHSGSNSAYSAVEGGELLSGDALTRFSLSLTQIICQSKKNIPLNQTVSTMVPSFYNLLPIYDYLIDYKTNTPKPVSLMKFQNNWLPTTLYQFPFFGTNVGAVSGTGFDTDQKYLTVPASGIQKSLHLWEDGYPKKIITSKAGDGRVLNISSYVPGAQNWTIHTTHGGLVTTAVGIQSISEFFTPPIPALRLALQANQKNKPDFHHLEETITALGMVSDSGSFIVRSPLGESYRDVDGLAFIENPIDGKYTVDVLPIRDKTTLYVGQILENNKILWKDYTIKKKQRITIRVKYDHEHPHENPFEDTDR